MTQDLFLRRKWTLRAHGEQVVFVKRVNERREHVLMKAFLWALYLPTYPDLLVEVSVGDRYKPDVVSLDGRGEPRFWGEAGHVSPSKIHSLVRRYRETHFALAKWDTELAPFIEMVEDALAGLDRQAPFDLLCFSTDSAQRFIGNRGQIELKHEDIDWTRLK
ncbi:MAG: hypothetical protein KGY78_00355 [Anaerolineae bacterium]|nr:hypothetical protein [Anaerolineae bacterium]